MIPLPVLLLLAMLPFGTLAQPVVVAGFDHPRSVWPTPGIVYVSCMGKELKPSAKDGDGYVSTLDPRGRLLDRAFLTGLHAPKGMAVVGGVLYIADVDHLVGYNLATRTRVFDLSFEPERTTLLTDVSIKNKETLFVSAADIGRVYEINLVNRTYTALAGRNGSPNGLCYEAAGNRLFVVGSGVNGQPGDVGVFSQLNGTAAYQTLLPRSGVFEGVAQLNTNTVLLSDWGTSAGDGKIWRFDLGQNALKPYAGLTGLNGPSDFGLFGQMLYVPQTLAGTVLIQKMD